MDPAPTASDDAATILAEILTELDRAIAQYPGWPTDPLHALAVLGEEYGELTQAMVQMVYKPHKNPSRARVRAEAIQTAAMALRVAIGLPSYQYQRSGQPHQAPSANA